MLQAQLKLLCKVSLNFFFISKKKTEGQVDLAINPQLSTMVFILSYFHHGKKHKDDNTQTRLSKSRF